MSLVTLLRSMSLLLGLSGLVGEPGNFEKSLCVSLRFILGLVLGFSVGLLGGLIWVVIPWTFGFRVEHSINSSCVWNSSRDFELESVFLALGNVLGLSDLVAVLDGLLQELLSQLG